MADYQHILYEVSDPVATITLNRPEAMNAWTPRMGAEVRHAVAQAEASPEVVGIIITGAGRAFCAGADMNNLSRLSGADGGEGAGGLGGGGGGPDDLEVDPRSDVPEGLRTEYGYLMASPKPIIAAINGAVAGMAVPIALTCDMRFMAEDAVLLTAFAQRGLIAEWGLAWLLPRLAGSAVALDLLLSSRKVTGAECERLGLVNRALPGDEVVPAARAYIEDLAARCSPASMAVMKRQVYEHLHAGFAAAEADSLRLINESFQRPDFKEGVTSFLEKRPPQFARISQ